MRKKNSANRQIKQFRFEPHEARQLMAINKDGPDTYITAGNSNNETEFIGSGNRGGTNRSPATELKAAFSWEMEKRFTDERNQNSGAFPGVLGLQPAPVTQTSPKPERPIAIN